MDNSISPENCKALTRPQVYCYTYDSIVYLYILNLFMLLLQENKKKKPSLKANTKSLHFWEGGGGKSGEKGSLICYGMNIVWFYLKVLFMNIIVLLFIFIFLCEVIRIAFGAIFRIIDLPAQTKNLATLIGSLVISHL